MVEGNVMCAECERVVDEFDAIAKRWGYWSGGVGDFLLYCAECARREFAPDARTRSSQRRYDAETA